MATLDHALVAARFAPIADLSFRLRFCFEVLNISTGPERLSRCWECSVQKVELMEKQVFGDLFLGRHVGDADER